MNLLYCLARAVEWLAKIRVLRHTLIFLAAIYWMVTCLSPNGLFTRLESASLPICRISGDVKAYPEVHNVGIARVRWASDLGKRFGWPEYFKCLVDIQSAYHGTPAIGDGWYVARLQRILYSTGNPDWKVHERELKRWDKAVKSTYGGHVQPKSFWKFVLVFLAMCLWFYISALPCTLFVALYNLAAEGKLWETMMYAPSVFIKRWLLFIMKWPYSVDVDVPPEVRREAAYRCLSRNLKGKLSEQERALVDELNQMSEKEFRTWLVSQGVSTSFGKLSFRVKLIYALFCTILLNIGAVWAECKSKQTAQVAICSKIGERHDSAGGFGVEMAVLEKLDCGGTATVSPETLPPSDPTFPRPRNVFWPLPNSPPQKAVKRERAIFHVPLLAGWQFARIIN